MQLKAIQYYFQVKNSWEIIFMNFTSVQSSDLRELLTPEIFPPMAPFRKFLVKSMPQVLQVHVTWILMPHHGMYRVNCGDLNALDTIYVSIAS